jgi:hypothetical protein
VRVARASWNALHGQRVTSLVGMRYSHATMRVRASG